MFVVQPSGWDRKQPHAEACKPNGGTFSSISSISWFTPSRKANHESHEAHERNPGIGGKIACTVAFVCSPAFRLELGTAHAEACTTNGESEKEALGREMGPPFRVFREFRGSLRAGKPTTKSTKHTKEIRG